jgi:hypothetical protein
MQQLGQGQEAIENLVNWLAPLETSGEALGNDFAPESLGLVQAKGLGEVATFYVNGPRGTTTNP